MSHVRVASPRVAAARTALAVAAAWAAGPTGCDPGAGMPTAADAAADASLPSGLDPRFPVEVVAVSIGPGGGRGADALPDVVLGPPVGGGELAGSTDTLSLGDGGSIVLRFAWPVVDGPGPDFIVFENPFRVAGTTDTIFAEPGQVAVGDTDGTFVAFPCDPAPPYAGCAGRTPVLAHPDRDVDPTDPDVAGGDAFDLADIGIGTFTLVRITDVGGKAGAAGTAGFDLDAVAAIHVLEP